MTSIRCPCSPTRQDERTASRRVRGIGCQQPAPSAPAGTGRDKAVAPVSSLPLLTRPWGPGIRSGPQSAGGGWLYEAVSSQICLAQSRFQVMAATSATLARRSCRSPARRERRPPRRRQAGPHADNSHKTQAPTPIPPLAPSARPPAAPTHPARTAGVASGCLYVDAALRPSFRHNRALVGTVAAFRADLKARLVFGACRPRRSRPCPAMIALRGQIPAGAWRIPPRPTSPPALRPTSLAPQAWDWLGQAISCQIHLAQSGNGGKADTLCAGLENRPAIGACGAQQAPALPAVTALHRWVLDGIWPTSRGPAGRSSWEGGAGSGRTMPFPARSILRNLELARIAEAFSSGPENRPALAPAGCSRAGHCLLHRLYGRREWAKRWPIPRGPCRPARLRCGHPGRVDTANSCQIYLAQSGIVGAA